MQPPQPACSAAGGHNRHGSAKCAVSLVGACQSQATLSIAAQAPRRARGCPRCGCLSQFPWPPAARREGPPPPAQRAPATYKTHRPDHAPAAAAGAPPHCAMLAAKLTLRLKLPPTAQPSAIARQPSAAAGGIQGGKGCSRDSHAQSKPPAPRSPCTHPSAAHPRNPRRKVQRGHKAAENGPRQLTAQPLMRPPVLEAGLLVGWKSQEQRVDR